MCFECVSTESENPNCMPLNGLTSRQNKKYHNPAFKRIVSFTKLLTLTRNQQQQTHLPTKLDSH